MMFGTLFALCLMGLVRAQNPEVFKYLDSNRTINISEDCNHVSCITKCCPKTQILYQNERTICIDNTFGISLENYTKVEIYNKDIEREVMKTEKTLGDFIFMYSDIFNDGSHFVFDSDVVITGPSKKVYILESGELAIRSLNYLQQWPEDHIKNDVFCIDLRVSAGADGNPELSFLKLVTRIVLKFTDDSTDSKEIAANISAGAMLVSCFFLLLVLAAYAVLPQKRNLPSLMLMAYVASLTTAFVSRAVQVFRANIQAEAECVCVGLALYYSWLASFTWMNVMSYDMWSTTSKPRPSRRWNPYRKTLVHFAKYSAYGFGAPLLATLFLVGIDFVDLTAVPGFVKPHFVAGSECFFEFEKERQLYMSVPVLITTAVNLVFFVLTAINIWRNTVKPGGSGDSRNTKRSSNRFIIYLKLFLVMGVNWILDVIATVSPESKVWLLTNVFNSLIGLFIFIIFVFKRAMFVLLCKRFSIESDLARKWEPMAADSSYTGTSVPKGRSASDSGTGSIRE